VKLKALPGQRSNIALFLSSIWAIISMFILIIGHLTIAFIVYGKLNDSNALLDLEAFLPVLSQTNLYITAGLALILDVWIFKSMRDQRRHKIQR